MLKEMSLELAWLSDDHTPMSADKVLAGQRHVALLVPSLNLTANEILGAAEVT